MRFDIASRHETVLKDLRGAQICSLAPSPDGAQLAYLVTNPPTVQGPSALEVLPAAGGEPRVVFRVKAWGGGASRFSGLAWTPDNRYVLFVRPPPLARPNDLVLVLPRSTPSDEIPRPSR